MGSYYVETGRHTVLVASKLEVLWIDCIFNARKGSWSCIEYMMLCPFNGKHLRKGKRRIEC
jgi:hypothetical protein